jgi:hypothetical protein
VSLLLQHGTKQITSPSRRRQEGYPERQQCSNAVNAAHKRCCVTVCRLWVSIYSVIMLYFYVSVPLNHRNHNYRYTGYPRRKGQYSGEGGGVIISAILSKKVCMYMCPIMNGFWDRAISLYSSLDLAPNIVLPFRTWIDVKRQLAVVTVDNEIVGVLWKMPRIITNAKYADMLYDVCCSHTSCKVHRCWQWNFRKCIILGKLYQL